MKENLIMTPEDQQAFERSMDLLDNSMREIRRVAHTMMPEALARYGLDRAMSDFCKNMEQSGALQVNYQSSGLADVMLDHSLSLTIYRVVQELVSHVVKHANAKTCIVRINHGGSVLSVTVEDNGKGFDSTAAPQSPGIGWANIRHRVNFLNGRIDVDSNPGKGTSVHIEFTI